MTINTDAFFFFVQPVNETNFQLSFSEGGPELIAALDIGSYSPSDFVIETVRAMNEVGGQIYSSVITRSTRKVTISAPGVFELKVSSGSTSGTTVFDDLGFSGADRTGSDSYEGDLAMGDIYTPQFPLQRFIDFEENQTRLQSRVNESASGQVEIVSFGKRKIMEANIMFATNLDQGTDGAITTNLTGVQDLIAFLEFAVDKNEFEFVPDILNPGAFRKILLESTATSRNGTAFKLREMKPPANYFQTGRLGFREL